MSKLTIWTSENDLGLAKRFFEPHRYIENIDYFLLVETGYKNALVINHAFVIKLKVAKAGLISILYGYEYPAKKLWCDINHASYMCPICLLCS